MTATASFKTNVDDAAKAAGSTVAAAAAAAAPSGDAAANVLAAPDCAREAAQQASAGANAALQRLQQLADGRQLRQWLPDADTARFLGGETAADGCGDLVQLGHLNPFINLNNLQHKDPPSCPEMIWHSITLHVMHTSLSCHLLSCC